MTLHTIILQKTWTNKGIPWTNNDCLSLCIPHIEYFRGVMPKAEVLVQLGPQTLLPRVRAQLADALLSFHGRVSLPLADANAVAAMYFSQMEEVAHHSSLISIAHTNPTLTLPYYQIMRETFRGLLSVPTLRDALAVAPIAPLYHSDYLLPLSGPLRQREGEAGRLLQVVRALFQTQVAAYVSPLYEFNPENMKNHMRVWRSGPLAGIPKFQYSSAYLTFNPRYLL